MKSLFLFLTLTFTAPAQDFEAQWKSLLGQVNAKQGPERIAALRAINQLVPGNSRLMLALSNALAPGTESSNIRTLLAKAGLVLESTDKDPWHAQVLENKQPVRGSRTHSTLPRHDGIAEDLVWDGKQFLISSVTEAAILREDGSVFAPTGISPFGLAIDPKRNLLWAAAGWTEFCKSCKPGGRNTGALLAFDLSSSKLVQQIDSVDLGDLAVAPNGDVYVTSNSKGALFVLPQGKSRLEPIGQVGELPSPQNPAITPDGKTLYLADYRRGIAAVDLASRQFRWLVPAPGTIVNGIDGLYVSGNSLLAIQNGITPVRIIRFSLDLRQQQILEANWPGLGEVTHGDLQANQFCFLANTGWDSYAENGARKPDTPPVVTTIQCRSLTYTQGE